MKIFVSHAVADAELAPAFVRLLQLGAGVPADDIFYSSRHGDVPNGAFFVQHILAELTSTALVVALVSRALLEEGQ